MSTYKLTRKDGYWEVEHDGKNTVHWDGPPERDRGYCIVQGDGTVEDRRQRHREALGLAKALGQIAEPWLTDHHTWPGVSIRVTCGSIGDQQDWHELRKEHGEGRARQILASALRRAAEHVEMDGYPDVFGCELNGMDEDLMYRVSVTLSHPWPG